MNLSRNGSRLQVADLLYSAPTMANDVWFGDDIGEKETPNLQHELDRLRLREAFVLDARRLDWPNDWCADRRQRIEAEIAERHRLRAQGNR